jgi:hypothetical protein
MTYEIPERVLRLAKEGGWIGVDLDGTLFTYTEWVGWNVFGEPIQPMIERVLLWLACGVEVRIVTARVGLPIRTERGIHGPAVLLEHLCRVTGQPFSDYSMIRAIQDHLAKHGLPRLKVQPHKDVDMIELWDDRAVQVVVNTGKTLSEEHEAELSALRGKQFVGTRVHASNQPHHPRS